MPKPIQTLERFCRAVEEVGRRGYTFHLVRTPATDGMRKPNDLRRFATIYWRSPSTSLWNPIQVVAKVLFMPKDKLWPHEPMAIEKTGLPPELAEELHKAIYPYRGYKRATRKRLLESCHLF